MSLGGIWGRWRIIKEQKLLLFAALFFLVAQLWMSWFLWQTKSGTPPGFDDSYFYMMTIDFVGKYGSLIPDLPGLSATQSLDTSLRTATYNLFLGGIARLFALPSSTVYYWSFFIGKVVLLGVLLFFLRRLRLTTAEQATALFLLGAYSGTAATHGFFWVVPSFWLFTIFLILMALVVSPPPRHWWAPLLGLLLAVVFFFIHPLSVWAVAVLALFTALMAWQSGDWRGYLTERRPFLVGLAIGFVLSELTVLLLTAAFGQVQPIHSLSVQLAGIGERSVELSAPGGFSSAVTELLPSAYLMWRGYFRFVLLPPVLLFLAWTMWRLIQTRRPELPLFQLAVLVGIISAALHPFGYRTVLFVWPLTLTMLAVGASVLVDWVRQRRPLWSRHASFAVNLGIVGLFAVLSLYSYQFVGHYRDSIDVFWDKACAGDLLAASQSDSIIEYSDKYAASAFMAHGLLTRQRGSIHEYLASNQQDSAQYFYVESARAVNLRSSIERELGRPLRLLRDCGFFRLYRDQT